MAEAVHNKGSLMEPVRTVDEQRVRLEHHLLELLEHERDYLAKKHQLLLKVEPLLEVCGLPPRRHVDRARREPKEHAGRANKKRNELTEQEGTESTKKVAGGDIKTWEQLYAAHPDVAKGVVKKFGLMLKQAGVWVPKPEKKKPRAEKAAAPSKAPAGAAQPEKKKKKV